MRLLAASLLFCALLPLAGASAAAQQLSIQAYVDHMTTGETEPITFTIHVTGDFQHVGRIEAPSVRGMTFRQLSPSRHWTRRVIGSREENSLRLQWMLIPDGVGLGQIGRARVEIDGRSFSTEPIDVRIVPQATRGTAAPPPPPPPDLIAEAPDLFLHAVPDRTTAFVGEQVVVDYVLYYLPAVHPRNARLMGAWDAPGFWREDLILDSPVRTRTVEIDGRLFEAATIRRAAFFATRSGRLTIDSLTISLDVLRAQRPGGRTGPLYNPFGARFSRQTLASPAIDVTVRPLPGGAPESFQGAVGRYEMNFDAGDAEVRTGEAVRLAATIRGDGNPATLTPPEWPAQPYVDHYPPGVSTQVERGGQRARAEHRISYALVPRSAEVDEIPALEWSFFDPEAGVYRTIRQDPIPLRVSGPTLAEGELTQRLHPPTLRLQAGRWVAADSRQQRIAPVVLFVGFALPPLALLGFLLTLRLKARKEERRQMRLSHTALRRAKSGLKSAPPGSPRDRARLVDTVLRTYLAERLQIAAHTMSLDELSRTMHHRGVSEKASLSLRALLSESDAIQFGGHPGDGLLASDSVDNVLTAIEAETRPLQ